MHSKDVKSFSRQKFLIVMVALIVTLFIDTSLVKLTNLIGTSFLGLQSKLILFSVNSSLCLFLQYHIINHVKSSFESDPLKRSLKVGVFYKVSLGLLGLLAALTAALLFQLFYYGYYYTATSISIIALSYGIAAALIISLSMSFFSWYKSNHSLIVLLYFMAMLGIAFNLIMTAAFVSAKISDQPNPASEYVGPSGDISGGRHKSLENVYKISSFISYFSIWITTAILMNYYRERLINAIAYLAMLSIPFVYFLITYFYQFFLANILSSYLEIDPVTTSIALGAFLSLSKPIGGLVFGVAFWKISKTMSYEKNIRIYMIFSGWGIFLIFSANQATTLIVNPYPPFGVITPTILQTGAFLMLIGIYNSATLVSVNNELRRTIHKQAVESRLLSIIGRAEMEKEIQKTVAKIARDTDKLEMETAKPIQLDENELKKYLDFVIKEVKKEGKAHDTY